MKVRYVVGGIALVIIYVVLFVTFHTPSTGPHIPGSSVSANPSGSLALAQLWQKQGHEAAAWEQVPELLPADTQNTLLVIEPKSDAYTDKDIHAMQDWIRNGHTVIWVSETAFPLMDGLGVKDVSSPPTTAITVRQQGSIREVWSNLNVPLAHGLSGNVLHDAQSEFVSSNGTVMGASFTFGKGTVICWTAPRVWENASIGQRDNLLVAWNLLNGHSVLWDEFSHGVVAQSMVGAMFSGGRSVALLFLGLAFATFLWMGFTRFGHPAVAFDEGPRAWVDFRSAFAWHLRRPAMREYEQSLITSAVVRRLSEYFHAGNVGLSMSELDELVRASSSAELRRHYGVWRSSLSSTHNSVRHSKRAAKELLAWMNQRV